MGDEDPITDPIYDAFGISMPSAVGGTPQTGYGCIVVNRVNPLDPNFLAVTVTLEYGSKSGNQKFSLTSRLLNPDR